jgi:hypothetical protein
MPQTGRMVALIYDGMEGLKSSNKYILSPMFHDFIRSIPDSLFLGSGLLALLTQSFSLGIFFLAMLEFTGVHRILGSFIGMVEPNQRLPAGDICTMGIPSPYQISLVGQLIKQISFPNGPIFIMTAAISYIMFSIDNFRDELKELASQGRPDWNTRIPVSKTFSALLFTFFMIYQIYYSCDNVLRALGSAGLGALTGIGIYFMHVYLFGRDSVNFLGLPLLEKTSVVQVSVSKAQ